MPALVVIQPGRWAGDEARALVQMRPENYSEGGKLCFPSGKMEKWDGDEKACAIREAFEEAGVIVAPHDAHPIGGRSQMFFADHCNVKFTNATHKREAQPHHKILAKVPDASPACNNHCWMSYSQIKKHLKLFAFHHGRMALQLMEKEFRCGSSKDVKKHTGRGFHGVRGFKTNTTQHAGRGFHSGRGFKTKTTHFRKTR
jgi:8-oxo-dGTP pyrophosphatase MutT (NUDIX family)